MGFDMAISTACKCLASSLEGDSTACLGAGKQNTLGEHKGSLWILSINKYQLSISSRFQALRCKAHQESPASSVVIIYS